MGETENLSNQHITLGLQYLPLYEEKAEKQTNKGMSVLKHSQFIDSLLTISVGTWTRQRTNITVPSSVQGLKKMSRICHSSEEPGILGSRFSPPLI